MKWVLVVVFVFGQPEGVKVFSGFASRAACEAEILTAMLDTKVAAAFCEEWVAEK